MSEHFAEVVAPVLSAAPAPLQRAFRLGVDIRSFKATRRLPLAVANIYARIILPQQLAELIKLEGGKVPSALVTPVRTSPPAEVHKGGEVTLPNGFCAVEFASSVLHLAQYISGGVRVLVELWHRDRYTTDAMLGLASVGLSPLLNEPYLDGYAPVQALVQPNAGKPLAPEKVTMGSMRVVVALEEFGELPVQPSAAVRDAARQDPGPRPRQESLGISSGLPVPAAPAASTQEGSTETPTEPAGDPADTTEEDRTMQDGREDPVNGEVDVSGLARGGHMSLDDQPQGGAAMGPADERGGAEYEAAWEVEMWKKAEMAKWCAEMKERELQRMDTLEAEWRKRERQREHEHRIACEEAHTVEERLKILLNSTEERERKLLAAEEALALKREAMERDMGSRMTEAQGAVRRLQEECEHQLDMERSRLKESERQNAVLEERLVAAEARAERIEHAFDAFRMEQRATPEAALHADLARLAQAKQTVEGQLEGARRAKAKYKEQVRRMARELAGLHRDRATAAVHSSQAAEAARTAKVAETQMAQLKAERRELRQLTQQLANMTQPAPAPPQPVPWMFPVPGYPGRGWTTSAAAGAEGTVPGGQENGHGAEELAKPAAAARLVSDSEEEAEAEDVHKDHARGARAGSAAARGSSQALQQDSAAASEGAPGRSAEPTHNGKDAPLDTSDVLGTAGPSTTPEEAGCMDSGAQARRLLQERADLVRTGVYRCGDRVIVELDRRIEALTKAAGST